MADRFRETRSLRAKRLQVGGTDADPYSARLGRQPAHRFQHQVAERIRPRGQLPSEYLFREFDGKGEKLRPALFELPRLRGVEFEEALHPFAMSLFVSTYARLALREARFLPRFGEDPGRLGGGVSAHLFRLLERGGDLVLDEAPRSQGRIERRRSAALHDPAHG